ncbi:MAG: c-type cytochrome [Luteimonas sp.]
MHHAEAYRSQAHRLEAGRSLALSALGLALSLALSACANGGAEMSHPMMADAKMTASDGPADQGTDFPRQDGNAAAGRDVFRFETFGNEGFWTDAVRLPQGMVAAGVTPLKALQLGVQIDWDAIDSATQRTLTEQLRADPSGLTSPLLNDPKMLVALVNANAVIGMPAKDSNHDGKMDVGHGDKAGASCALCHTMTDGAAFSIAGGGSIGHRKDGMANHNLDIGSIFASAANSRALYPVLQLTLKANGGKTLGRAPVGLTEKSTEADVDAYLTNKDYYPVGMFDDSFDGNGDPMHNTPLFRQDLAAPYGSEGLIARLDNFGNLVYTTLFDQTELTTKGGRAFLHALGGAAGDEIADDYVKILKETKVKGYPYVTAKAQGKPGEEVNPIGLRVDDTKLLDMNAYLASLPAPHGAQVDARSAARGREVFRTAGCTGCHNVDQGKRVPSFLVPMKTIFPGDNPVTLAQRMPPLNPVLNTPDSIYDDKMAVVNASGRGDIRGNALPLLLDLARKPVFLHDNSVANLDTLLNAQRGADAPHPFYLSDSQRADMIAFLDGLDTDSR